MSIQDLVALSGVPGLSSGLALLNHTYKTLESINLYRQQCKDLSNRCVSLMIALRDSSTGLEGSKAIELADELEFIIRRIDSKVADWASWNRVRSFLHQTEIRDGIDKFHRDLDAATTKFNITINLELTRGHRDLIAVQERDKVEMRELLETIVRSTDDMKALMNMHSPQPEAVENIMESLQTELRDPSLEPSQGQSFREALWQLHQGTSRLPPLTDLTGQVSLCKDNTVAKGSFHDVYMGEWLGNEKVALRLPRALANNPDVQRRFQREVKIWRELRHPNVVPLYGIVYIGEDVYSVSPWMDNGTANLYVQKYPNIDRLRILNEVALGLEYLHIKGIIHGDLRGANVLIAKDGTACLSDFGLSKLLENVGQGMTSSPGINPRWFAPELLRESGPVSTHSDVWSFAMVCLELMTGEQPFNTMPRDITVLRELDQGKIPERPGPSVTSRGLSDALWSLMRKCWNKSPESRPSITTIKDKLSQLRRSGTPPQALQRSDTIRSIFSLGRPSTAGSENSVKSSNSARRLRIPFMSPSTTHIVEETHSANSSGQISPISIRTADGRLEAGRNAADGGALRLVVTDQSGRSAAIPSHHGSLWPDSFGPPQPEESPDVESTTSLPANFGTHFPHQRTPSSESYSSLLPSVTSSFTNLSMSEPLRQAVMDSTSIHYLDRDGSVAAGTLEGLVERLINSSNLRKDVEYRDILLTTCTDYTTPEEFFAMLARKFREADTNTSLHPETRVAIRYNIFIIMNYWLSSPHIRVDPQLLWQMKDFASSALSAENSSDIMKNKAKDFLQSIDQRSSQDSQTLTSLLTPGRRIPKTSEILPHDLAIALTLLEGDKYRSILPMDYIAHLRRYEGPNNVETAYVVNNKIGFWVKKSILYYNHIESRANVLKFFVNTAQECRKFRNFASMSAIVNALQSAPIVRLTLTNKELSPSMRQLLDTLGEILDPHHNHQAYRAALRESLDLEYKDFCVPWLAVHVRDLHLLLRRHPPVRHIDGRPLINFERHTKFTAGVKDLLKYKPPDLERYRSQGQLAYLDHQLRSLHLEPLSDDELLEKSKTLAAEEARTHKKRTRELQSLGFRA